MIGATVKPEIVKYTFKGGNSGTVNLKIVRSSGGKITYNVNTTVSYGCTASAFQDALNKFDSFNKYQTTVLNRTIYDANNNVINSTTGAARIEYFASIYFLRTLALSA